MGLEHLKTAFNDIQKNELSDHGGPHGQGVHGGITNEFPSTPHYEHSAYGDIDNNILSKIQSPFSAVAGKMTETIPITTDYSLGTGIFSGLKTFEDLEDENIKKRSFDITTLGKDQELGLGNYVLESLYNKNHTPVITREKIDTGRKDFDGNAILIDTNRAGMGDLGKLDIKKHGSVFRKSLAGPEPYIVNDIGSDKNSIGHDRDLIPIGAALEDTSRLLQFYTSYAGLAFIAKENITNVAIGTSPNNNSIRRFLDPSLNFLPIPKLNTTDKLLLPPITNPIQGNTGFLNFTNQFRDLGPQIASARKPFTVEYSRRPNFRVPFGFLGDKAVKSVIADFDPIFEDATTKKPRFLGLGGGPTWTNNDKISDSGVIGQLGTDSLGNEALPEDNSTIGVAVDAGDFYVRIKDLRDNSYIYFRGFITGITENVSPSFTPTNYIGRSEPVYSYERAERDISFNIKVYPANLIQQNRMYEKIERLTSLAYPQYIEDENFTRMKPPFTELYMAHIGKKQKGQLGYIKSLSYTVNESGDWDSIRSLPRMFDIAISYQIINKRPPSLRDDYKFYGAGK